MGTVRFGDTVTQGQEEIWVNTGLVAIPVGAAVILSGNGVALAPAAGTCYGVAKQGAKSPTGSYAVGEGVPINRGILGTMVVRAGAATTAGNAAEIDSSGFFINQSGGSAVCVFKQAAAAKNGMVRVTGFISTTVAS